MAAARSHPEREVSMLSAFPYKARRATRGGRTRVFVRIYSDSRSPINFKGAVSILNAREVAYERGKDEVKGAPGRHGRCEQVEWVDIACKAARQEDVRTLIVEAAAGDVVLKLHQSTFVTGGGGDGGFMTFDALRNACTTMPVLELDMAYKSWKKADTMDESVKLTKSQRREAKRAALMETYNEGRCPFGISGRRHGHKIVAGWPVCL